MHSEHSRRVEANDEDEQPSPLYGDREKRRRHAAAARELDAERLDLVSRISALIDMQEELRSLFGREVDLLTLRAIEKMPNPFRRHAILSSLELIHAA